MSPKIDRQAESVPPVLRVFLIAVCALTLLCVGVEYACAHWLDLDRLPYNRATLAPSDDFADARMFLPRFPHFHQLSFFSPEWGSPFLYPAPNAFFYAFFSLFHFPAEACIDAILLIYLGLGLWLCRALIGHGVKWDSAFVFTGLAAVTSYPFYFEYNRGNVELFVWGLSALGILAFFRDRPWLAATLIGLAGACKGYPFLYLGLPFARKQYREVIYAVVVGVAANLASLWAIAGDFSIGRQGVAAGLEGFRQIYVLRYNAAGLDHSLFGFLKRFWVPLPPPETLAHVLTVYLCVAGLAGGAAYFLRVWRMPPINQVIFLSIACVLLPPTSYDYTLLHLYTGWVMLVFLAIAAWRNGNPAPRGVWLAFICYIVLLSPQNEVIVHGERLEGQIKCLALLALSYVVLRYPLANPTPLALEA